MYTKTPKGKVPKGNVYIIDSNGRLSPYKNLGVFATSGKLVGSSKDKEAL